LAEFAKIKEKKTSGNKKGAKKEEGPDLEGRVSRHLMSASLLLIRALYICLESNFAI